MQMFELVILICFAVMALDLLYVVTKILCLKRADRIEFVRSFKKGRCSFIYFVAFPLFLCGRLYTGQEFLKAIFSSIHYIVKLVILQYDITPIEALMNDSTLYANAIYFCYTLVAFNVILFALSIFNQKIWYGFRTIFFRFRRKEKYILLGSNEENLSIFRSTPPHSAQIVDLLTDEQCNTYYMEDIGYHDLKVWDDLVGYVSRQHRKRDDAKLYIIVNSGSEEQNVLFCQRLVGYIQSLDHPDLLFGLEIYVFGDARYEGLYEDLMKQAKGCLHYLNKYQKVAVDMIDRFPFTRFMDDRHIDFDTSLVCGEVDINVALIGFGNTNRQIFLTSVANNQFITQGEDGEPHIKPVHYHIIDKQDAHSNKNLNHSYYRFTHEFSTIQNREDEYLPFPDLPAAEHYYQMDINELSFYSSIRRVFSRHPLDVNFIVVAFGSDLENMDMAKKLIEKRNEWKLPHLVIFVKIR
ncbi:MAG: hypothetical protein J6R42_03130, partial [Clostridia bacterium]|nr:hypothetical protein [Clostridia bacterium]